MRRQDNVLLVPQITCTFPLAVLNNVECPQIKFCSEFSVLIEFLYVGFLDNFCQGIFFKFVKAWSGEI